MHVINLALRLLRLANEALFLFELNRLLGRLFHGTHHYRRHRLTTHESQLLSLIHAPYRTVRIPLPCGLQIHTVIAGAGAPDDRAVVLLHGHSMGGALFSGIVDLLLAAGYSSVYAPDLPGWGGSSRPKFLGGGWEDGVRFFVRPLGEWVSALGLGRFTLVGHSMGAYVAHEYALSSGAHQVRRLVLASPAAVTRGVGVARALWFAFTPQRFLTHGGLVALLLFGWRYPRGGCYNLRGMREYLLCANSMDCATGDAAAAAMLRFWRADFGGGGGGWRAECVQPLVERVSRLSCPVDLIAGDGDPLVRLDHVRALYARMVEEGNQVGLRVIAGADHTPHLWSPSKFVKAIMAGMPANARNVGVTDCRRESRSACLCAEAR